MWIKLEELRRSDIYSIVEAGLHGPHGLIKIGLLVLDTVLPAIKCRFRSNPNLR